MQTRSRWVEVLPRLYAVANRSGLLDSGWARRLFVRSYFAYKRYVEDPFFALVKSRPELFSGGDIVDVGANIGYTASVFATGLAAGRRVYAFEPDPKNFALLLDSIRQRQAGSRILPVQAAVGARGGTVRLWHNDRHHGDHRIATDSFTGADAQHLLEVPMVSVDEYGRSAGWQVGFIKIDVQGYEPAVCEGMLETIQMTSPTVAIEYTPHAMRELGFPPENLLPWFVDRGYSVYVLGKHATLTPAQPNALAGLEATRGYVDLVCSKRPLSTP